MADASTTIEYEIVRNGVTKIEEINNRMETLFGDFDNSMNKALNPDVFKGVAADTVGSDYTTLKSQYAEFNALVKQFADEYRNAANLMEQHEQRLDKATSVLNQDLHTRM